MVTQLHLSQISQILLKNCNMQNINKSNHDITIQRTKLNITLNNVCFIFFFTVLICIELVCVYSILVLEKKTGDAALYCTDTVCAEDGLHGFFQVALRPVGKMLYSAFTWAFVAHLATIDLDRTIALKASSA